jgi:aminopeptidase N
MFAKVAAFELRYQLRQPAFWVISILFGLMGFGLIAAGDNISIGGGGNTHLNSPFSLILTHMVLAVFFMLATTAIVANVVARDASTGFGPMIQSSRLSKFDYLYGRFLGAFIAVALCYLSVSIGTIIGTLAPWVDRETLGAFRPDAYAFAYLVMGLPAVFLTSAIFFALATVTRSMMATYVGVVAFFIVYLTLTSSLDRPEFREVLAWLEPFGLSAITEVTRYWTPAERNTSLPDLGGVLLGNRVLWTLVGVAFLAAAYALYRPAARGAKAGKQDKLRALAARETPVVTSGPLPKPSYGAASAWAQLRKRTAFEMAFIFKSPAFLVLIVLGAFNSIGALLFAGEMYGAPTLLVTRTVIQLLTGAFGLVSIIIAIYYSGELVWRDRERRTHEIVDSTAAPDWTFLLPKVLGLTLVLAATLLVGALSGMAVQAYKGAVPFEVGKYLLWYVLPETISYALLAVLAIFIQALSPNKFVGWAIMVVYMISTIVLSNLGFDHRLYRYGSVPGVPLSDMNGQGSFIFAANWVTAYWTAFAVVLMVITYGLWRRGTETRFLPRLRRLPSRLKGGAGLIGGVALAAFVALGVFVFINTNVWNEYRSRDDNEKRQAAYEKALLRYENTPQPSVVSVVLDLDLHPHEPRLTTKGSYVIENRTGAPLSEMHLRWLSDEMQMTRLDVEGASMAREWKDFDYRIYRFATPMAPGERRTVSFETVVTQKGFPNSGAMTSIVDNGTFINNSAFAPAIGMNRQGLLSDRTKRRKYGLEPELRMAKLEDTSAQARNYIGADWVNADITVRTVADQTPIAPGYKVSDTTANGRRVARFVTEAPILHFFSVQSARYALRQEAYKGVNLAIYYHPAHDMNVGRMISSLKAGLDYFQSAFGPYQFRQARIVEFPAYASFAQAFANTMPYSESIGFIADFRNPEKIDYVTYVTAHELGHQWWAHQVIGADMQGGTSLSETLAQYSALMVMEKTYGRDNIRRFLKYELDRYLMGRATERLEEMPLYRVENQGYIHYQKGGLVMYLLRDQLGEEAVNAALRFLIQTYAFKSAPYPRSLDLVNALRANAPADKQALITDLFERITLYDVRVTDTTARRLPNGKWDVAVTVQARKFYADGKGKETDAPLNEVFDVGLFSAEPGKRAFDEKSVIAFDRRPIRTGTQVLRFVTSEKPAFAGVDPYNKWIDRDSNDNVEAVD